MPSVSIIVPCYNEQATIRKLLEAIYAQTYPQQNLEVVIADGISTDATRAEIIFFANAHPNLAIKVVDNPKRHIPAGLNCAMKESRGGIIIRLDAHSMPYPDYVECCVKDLAANLGDNVGGIWEIKPGADTWIAKSIALAAAHPLGVGDALYRHGTKAALVDTVPFGAFKRGVLALVGFFDETLLANEDYEFNARIRKSGGRIWLDPAIRSVYFSRSSLGGLARQYFNYGYWKWRMLRRYPDTLRWRQGLPPAFRVGYSGAGIDRNSVEWVLDPPRCSNRELPHYPDSCRDPGCSAARKKVLAVGSSTRHCHHAYMLGSGLFMEYDWGEIQQVQPGAELMRSLSRPRPSGWRVRPREQRTILLIGDMFVSLLALLGGLYFWGQKDSWLNFSLGFLQERVEFWFYLLPFIWMVFLVELYDLHRAKNLRQTTAGIAIAALAGIFFYAVIYLISPKASLPRLGIGFFLLFVAILTFLWRLIYIQIFTAQAFLRRVLVIGAGNAGQTIVQAFKSLRPQPFFLVGFMDDDPKKIGKKVDSYPVLAGNDRLLEIIRS